VTRDFINPEAAWPQIARLRQESAARGFTLRERLALYPEYLARPEFLAPAVRERALRLTDGAGYAREDAVAFRGGAPVARENA